MAVSPPGGGRQYGTLTVDTGDRQVGGVRGMPSPSVRYEKPTRARLREIHDWAIERLHVGQRTVTVDILGRAFNTVVWNHPEELLDAIRAEIVRKAQEIGERR